MFLTHKFVVLILMLNGVPMKVGAFTDYKRCVESAREISRYEEGRIKLGVPDFYCVPVDNLLSK